MGLGPENQGLHEREGQARPGQAHTTGNTVTRRARAGGTAMSSRAENRWSSAGTSRDTARRHRRSSSLTHDTGNRTPPSRPPAPPPLRIGQATCAPMGRIPGPHCGVGNHFIREKKKKKKIWYIMLRFRNYGLL